MSVKLINRGTIEKGTENAQRKILRRQNTIQTPVVFHSVSKPSPLLSDVIEFPSLNESTGRTLNNSHLTGGTLKYSDKLKSQSFQKQVSLSENFSFKTNAGVANMCNQLDDETLRTKSQRLLNKNKADNTSNKNNSKELADKSLKEHTYVSEAQSDKKKYLTKQKCFVNTSTVFKSSPDSSSAFVSNTTKFISRSSNNIQSNNKSIKLSAENSEVKEKNDDSVGDSKAKKKKKRKSKVKRQVNLQSGKITVLTPEVHLKILNQTKTFTTQNFKSTLTDINDEDEYPELGKSILQPSQREIFSKNSISECQRNTVDKSDVTSAENNHVATENVIEESPENIISVEKTVTEKKGKGENKEKVHSNDPITISFYDMLLDKNHKPKIKEEKKEVDSPITMGLVKMKMKKNKSHPHNLLDSSSPAIKRGKERENPKPKKPSQLKKIILLDRKARREQLLQMKSNYEEENAINFINDNELNHKAITDEDDVETGTEKSNLVDKNNFEHSPSSLPELDEDDKQAILLLTENAELNSQGELVAETRHLNLSEVLKNCTINDLSSVPYEDTKVIDSVEKSVLNLSCNKIPNSEKSSSYTSQITVKSDESIEVPPNIPRSPDSLLNSLIGNVKSEICDKERAAKILLHTRNFREYCNHLISKDIDDVVYALLDDLARFQDRLHQKDPIKARMKRRMIYGVKEVRKHIKLRKLKCIIIAVDIENVEAQGGLNDVLNDIKVSAVDHQIPCVFALSRKVLGKVCRKPVPVSCVGVFSYEGSETNFKKMVELQTQSKADYAEIFSKLMLKITEEEVETLLRAKKEAPETLRAIRTSILNDFFLESKSGSVEKESMDEKSESSSDSIDLDT